MSFSFYAVGTKEDVIGQLEKVSITGGADRFNLIAIELRTLLADHFRAETAHPGGGHEYRYAVTAGGHGGGQSPLTLDIKVTPHWVPVPDVPMLTEAGEAAATVDEDLADDVIAAIDHFRGSLGFAAPELHDEKWAQLREQVKGILSAPDTDDDEDED